MFGSSDFECNRCGYCCRNILEVFEGVKRGLPLTEKETELFKSNFISPKLGFGLNEPSIVVLYQLNVNVCPYVTNKNECEIYDKRPLICRSFPIVGGSISNKCRLFSYRKVGVSYTEPFSMERQLQASKKLDSYTINRLKKYFEKGIKLWEYNLLTNLWIFNKQYDVFPNYT